MAGQLVVISYLPQGVAATLYHLRAIADRDPHRRRDRGLWCAGRDVGDPLPGCRGSHAGAGARRDSWRACRRRRDPSRAKHPEPFDKRSGQAPSKDASPVVFDVRTRPRANPPPERGRGEKNPGALSNVEGRPGCRPDLNRSDYFIASRADLEQALAYPELWTPMLLIIGDELVVPHRVADRLGNCQGSIRGGITEFASRRVIYTP